jgi:hypothetical protein
LSVGGRPASRKRLPSCPHRAHVAAPGAAFAIRFPGISIQLRGDAGFALPLLYEFCEFFAINYAIGIPANCAFQRRAQPLQQQLKQRYRRTQVPQRSFSSFRHRAHSWPRQRRICYKAEPEPTCALW